MATVTANLTGYLSDSASISWNDDISLGVTFSSNGNEIVLTQLKLFDFSSLAGLIVFSMVAFNRPLHPGL